MPTHQTPKEKYKIGTLVEFTTPETNTTKHAIVQKVLKDVNGFSYQVENEDTFVSETHITKAFKPVNTVPGTRKRGPRKAKLESASQISA